MSTSKHLINRHFMCAGVHIWAWTQFLSQPNMIKYIPLLIYFLPHFSAFATFLMFQSRTYEHGYHGHHGYHGYHVYHGYCTMHIMTIMVIVAIMGSELFERSHTCCIYGTSTTVSLSLILIAGTPTNYCITISIVTIALWFCR